MNGDPDRPGAAADQGDPFCPITESEWKWIELLRTICDGNVPPPDMNEIRTLGETVAGHRRKLI